MSAQPFSILGLVPNRIMRYSHRPSLYISPFRIRPTGWSDAHWLENDRFPAPDFQVPFPASHHSNLCVVYFLGVVVQ